MHGVQRKDKKKIAAPPLTELPESFPFGRQTTEQRVVAGVTDANDGEHTAATPDDISSHPVATIQHQSG